jgi:uridine kinase
MKSTKGRMSFGRDLKETKMKSTKGRMSFGRDLKKSMLIGMCGRTASGKTTGAKLIQRTLTKEGVRVGVISMDDFYLELSEEEHQRALQNEHDFDCLEAFDLEALLDVLTSASRGEVISFKRYDHASHKHHHLPDEMGPFDAVVFEGLYLFADQTIADMFDFRVFMEVDADESLIRRLRRDIVKRRRDMDGVLRQYERYVMPAYNKLVAPSKRNAHIIIPHGAHNQEAMNLVYSFIRAELKGNV